MTEPHAQPDKLVFISYARRDHSDDGQAPDCFVQKLYRALKEAGFTPWLDHIDLPSRGTPFPKELALAVQGAERFIAVCGPAYPASDWCRAEREHAHLYCIAITPVLVAGDFKDCVPGDIDHHNAIDMRAGFEATWPDLLKRLSDSAAQPGKLLYGAGELPEQRASDLPRPVLFDQVKQSLRTDQTDPVTISGTRALTAMVAAGGIGKSTLAAQVARDCEVRRGFPDGVAWVRLGEQVTDPETLRILVGGAFGIPAESLRGPQGSVVFVQELQDRDALIVLDDVWSLAQAQACRVQGPNLRYLITTRRSDLGEGLKLPPENRIKMDYLTVEEGLALIARRLGLDPAADDPHQDTHRQIVETLGGHTQAIDLAASHLRPRDEGGSGPDYAPTLLAQLGKGDNTLFDLLMRGVDDDSREGNLLKSLSVSYTMLPRDPVDLQRCFRLLGIFAPGGSLDAAAAAAVWEMDDPERAHRLLNELVARSLVIATEGDRYTLHALIHAAARVLLNQNGEASAAFDRYADHVIEITRQFDQLPLEEWHTLTPDLPHVHTVGDALADRWQQAHDAPDEALTTRAIQFAINTRNYVNNRPQMVDTPRGRERLGLRWLEMGLSVCRQMGDQRREALFCNELGLAWDTLGEKRQALAYYEQALPLSRAVGDRRGEATTLTNIGGAWDALGEKRRALEFYEQSLPLSRAMGDRRGEAITLNNIGMAWDALGEKRKALEFYEQTLPLSRAVGDRRGEASTLNNIGSAWDALGEKRQALEFYQQALPLSRAVGDRRGEATTLTNIGLAWDALGEKRKALEFYEQALPLSRAVGDRRGEASTLNNIGLAWDALGEKRQALEFYEQALPLSRAVGDRRGEATTLSNIGGVYFQQGDLAQAADTARQIIPIAHEMGSVAEEAAFRANLASALHGMGQTAEAIQELEKAIAILERHNLPYAASGESVEQYEALLMQLKGSGTPAPGGPSTLPAETVSMMGGNTVAVMTELPDKLDEWREQLQHARADFAGQGDGWATEVAFADALLAVLDDQPTSLPDDNPYAPVLHRVIEVIEQYRTTGDLPPQVLPNNQPTPDTPSTLPAETVNALASNTVAVKTEVPDKLDEWCAQLQHARADFAGQGDAWAIEIAFAAALLAVLDDQPAALPDDNPYAPVLRQVIAAIHSYSGE